MPVVGHGYDDGPDVGVGEELLIFARDGDVGAGNFFGEGLAAVPEIAGSQTFGAGKLDGGLQQSGALHANADDAEVDQLCAGAGGPLLGVGGLGERDGSSGERESGGLEKAAAGEVFRHGVISLLA